MCCAAVERRKHCGTVRVRAAPIGGGRLAKRVVGDGLQTCGSGIGAVHEPDIELARRELALPLVHVQHALELVCRRAELRMALTSLAPSHPETFPTLVSHGFTRMETNIMWNIQKTNI